MSANQMPSPAVNRPPLPSDRKLRRRSPNTGCLVTVSIVMVAVIGFGWLVLSFETFKDKKKDQRETEMLQAPRGERGGVRVQVGDDESGIQWSMLTPPSSQPTNSTAMDGTANTGTLWTSRTSSLSGITEYVGISNNPAAGADIDRILKGAAGDFNGCQPVDIDIAGLPGRTCHATNPHGSVPVTSEVFAFRQGDYFVIGRVVKETTDLTAIHRDFIALTNSFSYPS